MKILYIIPSQYEVYSKTLVKEATTFFPLLSFATISSLPAKNGCKSKLIDGNFQSLTKKFLKNEVEEFNPDFVAITVVTALVSKSKIIADVLKQINPNIKIIVGGPHISSLPLETFKKIDSFDVGILGEGDFVFNDIICGKDYSNISGIVYRENGEIKVTPPEEIMNLDELPFPNWSMYNLKKYSKKEIRTKNTPIGWLETARGCVYKCCYCNKSVFGLKFRKKSPERVVEEFKYYKKLGFKQINIADDNFTTDVKRAEKICDLLIEEKVDIPWSPVTGIRVNTINERIFKKMKAAGCYSVCFGIESGDQKILDGIPKQIKLEQVKKAVKLAKEANLETVGYFMLGLPGETEETMQKTIDFACSLGLDMAKASITIPLPATPLYEKISREGRFKTLDWEKFNFYVPPSELYTHENLEWETVDKYFKKFYRQFYFRPSFILKKLIQSIKERTLFDNIKLALTTKW